MPRKNKKINLPEALGPKDSQISQTPKPKGEITSFKKQLSTFKLTEKQQELLEAFENNNVIILLGPAGTGKTIVSCYYTIKVLSEHKFEKILCTKPIMEAGEKLGALPGDVADKINPYYESFRQNFSKLIGKEDIKKLIDKEIIDYRPISYMRGTTWDNCIMWLDESQNMDVKQLILFVTRMGKNSKVILSGDVSQSDIQQQYVALPWLANLIKNIDGVSVFEFDEKDIMRNKMLIEITKKYEEAKVNGTLPKNKYN
jgi:phosphate starvation-inducible PhoH-like protein